MEESSSDYLSKIKEIIERKDIDPEIVIKFLESYEPVQTTAKTFGEYVKELRKRKGLTQRELAKESDITYSYIPIIERSSQDYNPTPKLVQKLAKSLTNSKNEARYLYRLAGLEPEFLEEQFYDDTSVYKKEAPFPLDKIDYIECESYGKIVDMFSELSSFLKREHRKFGNRILTLRQQKDFTQEELGNLVGVSGEYISMIETCRKIPSRALTGNLVEILNDEEVLMLRDLSKLSERLTSTLEPSFRELGDVLK